MSEEDVYNETLRLTLERDLDAFTKAGMTEEAGKVKARLDGVEIEAPLPEVEAEVEAEDEIEDTGTGEYEGRTRLQLVNLARKKGVKGAAQMKKDELIEELREG